MVVTIVNEDLTGDDYHFLLEVAAHKCNTFAFVKRRDMMANETIAMKHFYELVEEIQDSFIEMKEQSEWETTRLLESTAYVFYYKLDEKTKQFLQKKSDSLFSWLSPYLPEDLMLFNDNQIWFAGCSHERWFTCNINVKINNSEEFINYLRKEFKF